MDLGLVGPFIIAGILAVQFFLSTRESVYWGALLPAALVVSLTFMLITDRIDSFLAYFLYLLLGLFFLILEWSGGRKYVQEKRKKELDKMKSFDMN